MTGVERVPREDLDVSRRELLAGTSAVAGAAVTGAVPREVAAQADPDNEISGTVTDAQGAVQGATVVAVPHDSGLDPLVTTTDAQGDYTFSESDLYFGDEPYHVIARDGTESDPRRGQENYPFLLANGGTGIPDSVVSRWQFNEGSGSTATDSVGSNNGSVNGATYTTTAQEGSHALDFDGTDDSVVVPNDASLEPSSVSAVAWMRAESLSTFQRLLHKGMGTVKYGMSTDDASDHITAFWDGGNGEHVQAFGTSFSTGTWYHVGLGADANGVDVYVNGSPDNGSGPSTNWGDDSADLHIGERAGGNAGHWDGIIDDVILANEKWTDQEFAGVYNLY